ncbi:O-antigen ligase family protein [Acidipropionibacterium timonense]|uniref:O-antigen ligase family protein n=1 Tax=Acidipropionibacterium timonense TaxID=2161818 RepID=UPI00103019E9|nr:O-antigen ligase family protein [Acidipropionibacterium timonense]
MRTHSWPGWPDLLGWGLVLLVLGAQFVDLRHGITRPWLVSLQLVICVAAILVAAPVAWRARPLTSLTRTGTILVGGFTLMEAWALVSSMVSPLAVIRQGVIPRAYQVVPVLTGWVTMAAVLVVLLALGPRGRRRYLPRAALALVLGAFADWPVQAGIHGSGRLASGMGGSAVLHVALVLAAAVLVDTGLEVAGQRRALWFAAGGLAVLGTLLTGSRAAFLVVVLVVAVLLVVLGRGAAGRLVRLLAGVGVVIGALAVVVVPTLHRLTTWQSPQRLETLRVGWRAVSSSPWTLVFGVGSGSVFPWYAVEAKLIPVSGDREVITRFGRALSSAHSVYLEVLTELGLVMTLVLAALVIALWTAGLRSLLRWRHGAGGSHERGSQQVWPRGGAVTALAVCATTLAWAFDTYLVKNFAVSLWWWVVALSAVGLVDDRGRTDDLTDPGSPRP